MRASTACAEVMSCLKLLTPSRSLRCPAAEVLLFLFFCSLADVTVISLRCEDLSACAQLPFATVQCCVYETVTSFFRAISRRQDTDFVFKSVGILSIRKRKATMRFFDDFLLTVDDTGKLLEVLLGVS